MTDDAPTTPEPKRKFSFAAYPEVYAVYADVCSRLDTTLSARLSEHMYNDIRLHGTDEERATLEWVLANAPKRGPKKKA